MPNAADQPTDGSRRGTLFAVALAAAVAAGLWFYLDRPGVPTSAERLESKGPATGVVPAADDTRTAESGVPRATDAGIKSSDVDSRTTDADTVAPNNVARTAQADTTPQAEEPGSTRAESEATTDIALTTDIGATTREEDSEAAGSETKVRTDLARTPDAGSAGEAPNIADTTGVPRSTSAGTDSAEPSSNGARIADSATTGDAQQSVAAEPAATPAKDELVLAAAPELTVEKSPVDAPPVDEASAATDILAAVEGAIERIESAIQERLNPESASDPDTKLRVQVTYDDSQEDAAKGDGGSSVAAQTTESDASIPTEDAPTPGSDVVAGADIARLTEPGVAPPSAVDQPADTPSAVADPGPEPESRSEAEAEAKKFVETLTGTAPETIAVDRADHFVTRERVLSMVPEDSIESVTLDELAKDESFTSGAPITVVREVEQIEPAVPEQLIADSGGDLDKRLRVRVTYDDSQDTTGQGGSGPAAVEEAGVEQMTVREALERIRAEPEKPLTVIRKVRYFEVVTLRELLDTVVDSDTSLNVVTRPYRVASATLADLLKRHKAENPDSIFYLHTVQPTDEQGIWGIVHFGLIDNFARGMAIHHGKDIETYTVRIPRDADERLEDESSSFLGKLIDRKTKDSYVYNFRKHRMGRNPDRIYPGQELVIINFEPEELMSIYRHFDSG